jgi:hypothetical protein
MPAAGSGRLQISGTINGVSVKTGYNLGSTPQYPNWIRLLFQP